MSAKWKSNLLSSSVPLEFEVSKQLAKANAIVFNDYAYLRSDGAVEKEFSVDLLALMFTPHTPADRVPIVAMSVLLECKHRHPNTVWLFLPKHEPTIKMRGMPNSIIKTFDQFSPWFVHDDILPIDRGLRLCSKGVEIDTNSNAVQNAELRHGMAQLQFALPKLIASQIRSFTYTMMPELPPMFVTMMLVTNAPLYVASWRLSTALIESASEPAALGRRVPFLAIDAGAGPELERHAAASFGDLPSLMNAASFKMLDSQLEAAGLSPSYRPHAVAERAALGGEWQHEFRRLIVCNKHAVPLCLRRLKDSLLQLKSGLSREPRSYMLVQRPSA